MTQPTQNTNEMRDFLLVLRRALLLILDYIEKRYISNKSTTPPVPFGAQDSTKP